LNKSLTSLAIGLSVHQGRHAVCQQLWAGGQDGSELSLLAGDKPGHTSNN
jgi:hypothetical protein